MTFADVAVRLCSVAAQSLAWRPGEFWTATPSELAACLAVSVEDSPAASSEMLAALLRQFPDRITEDGR